MNELGDIDQLENLLRGANNPGALAEVDIDRARELLGDDAARSLDRLSELAKMLEEAGLIEQKEGRFELTPARHPQDRPATRSNELFQKLGPRQDGQARDRAHRRRPRAGLRDQALRVRRSVQPQHRAHGPQRDPAARAAARRCSSRPTTSRSSAPSTSSGRAPC